LRKERKELIRGTKTDLQGIKEEKTISRREESRLFDSGVEKKS
jgi:hypothetical protein